MSSANASANTMSSADASALAPPTVPYYPVESEAVKAEAATAEAVKAAEEEAATVAYPVESEADSGEEAEELGSDDWPSGMEEGEVEEALSSSSSSSSSSSRPLPKRARLAARPARCSP